MSRNDRTAAVDSGFTCCNCGRPVSPVPSGGENRNHCPFCLWSRHVDNKPGDRLCRCQGVMEPVAVWVKSNGEWSLIHRCRNCGTLRANRIAADDNEELLLSIAVRPLAMPAFPLDSLYKKR